MNPRSDRRGNPRPKRSDGQRTGNSAALAQDGLRIIGGSLRGQKLLRPDRAGTRPMKDRVREAVFNLIGRGIRGAVAIDLFAGAGALGLEALSRGAAEAILIEQHFPTARLIEENVRHLDLQQRARVVAGDAFFWGRQSMAVNRRVVVFCSPPYALYDERTDDLCALLVHLALQAAAGSLLVVEFDDRFSAQQLPFPEAWETRRYAPANVALCEVPFPEACSRQPEA